MAENSLVTSLEEQIDEGAHLIPFYMLGAVKRYLIDAVKPGDFLSALLSNDFMAAVGKADDQNQRCLLGWAHFLYNHMPAGSFGSPEQFAAILQRGSLRRPVVEPDDAPPKGEF